MNPTLFPSLRKSCLLLHRLRWASVTKLSEPPSCLSLVTFRGLTTKPDTTGAEKPKKTSAWKSSGETKLTAEQRNMLYKRMNLDFDVSHLVNEEILLYEVDKPLFYRILFLMIVMQYFFFIFCAQVLINFYSGVDSEGNKLFKEQDLKNPKKKHFARKWLEEQFENGTAIYLKGGIIVVGHLVGASLLWLLTRCVASIRLMPGGTQIKLSTKTMFGGNNPDKYKLINVSDLSTAEHRGARVNYYRLHQRGRVSTYLIDTDGKFFKPDLYDKTVGLSRNLHSPQK